MLYKQQRTQKWSLSKARSTTCCSHAESMAHQHPTFATSRHNSSNAISTCGRNAWPTGVWRWKLKQHNRIKNSNLQQRYETHIQHNSSYASTTQATGSTVLCTAQCMKNSAQEYHSPPKWNWTQKPNKTDCSTGHLQYIMHISHFPLGD